MSPSDEIDTSQYSPEELRAAVFEAEAVGTYVAAHVYSSRSIRNCVSAGIRTLEHCNLLDESPPRPSRRPEPSWSDAGHYEMISAWARAWAFPTITSGRSTRPGTGASKPWPSPRRLGVKIASGSDLLGPMQRYKGMELELQARVLGPMERSWLPPRRMPNS